MTCEEHFRKALQAIADGFQKKLEDVSPIDTGYFKGNWKQEVNTDGCVISNDAPYAVALEEGHSQQAPQGMLRQTLMASQSIVDAAIRNYP